MSSGMARAIIMVVSMAALFAVMQMYANVIGGQR